jgi:hemerythrin-like domain-containing protein
MAQVPNAEKSPQATQTPTKILMQEHVLIEKVLAVLETLAEQVDRGRAPDRTAFGKALEFLSGFADMGHHMKEEEALFPALVERGMPVLGSPIGVMLHEHEEGRAHLRGLREALGGLDKDPAGARRRLVDEAREYVHLLRQHIEKENVILFRMADEMLDAVAVRKVLVKFDEADSRLREERARHLRIVEELEKAAR